MDQPRHREVGYILGGAFHRLALTAWGDPHNEPVVCVHGLSRNARDFDVLAEALSDRFYVLCPDLPGRGRSSWLPEAALYQPLSYVQALSHLLAFIDRPVLWLARSPFFKLCVIGQVIEIVAACNFLIIICNV